MGDASATRAVPTRVNRGYRLLFALMAAAGVAAGLAACTPQVATVSPEQRLAMIPTGEPLLSCRANCLTAWRAAEPQAETLAARHRWADLALFVLRVNYEDDLSTYYLAEAAQGMGYHEAAASYYRQSVELSHGPAACAAYSRLCGGVALPRAALVRLAGLSRPAPRRQKPVAKTEEPAAAPAPQPTPVRAPSREEEQYIEPPPARP